jgi:hypothetical protein
VSIGTLPRLFARIQSVKKKRIVKMSWEYEKGIVSPLKAVLK